MSEESKRGGDAAKRATLDVASERYYYSDQQIGVDNRFRARMIRRCLAALKSPAVLELGFMDGQWTDEFLERGCTVDVVEGARRMADFARAKYSATPGVVVHHCLFEEFEPTRKYDTILMGGMLKHLNDPGLLLRRSTGWLNEGGVLIATTPNPRSLHRRIGTYMGILEIPEQLTETDRAVANLRHYDRYSFRALLEQNGYAVTHLATSMLRLVSGDKMADWDDSLLDALDKIADELQDYGWYIYAIATPHEKR